MCVLTYSLASPVFIFPWEKQKCKSTQRRALICLEQFFLAPQTGHSPNSYHQVSNSDLIKKKSVSQSKA